MQREWEEERNQVCSPFDDGDNTLRWTRYLPHKFWRTDCKFSDQVRPGSRGGGRVRKDGKDASPCRGILRLQTNKTFDID